MITVFTASYNYSGYLETAIRSVLGQTYKDFEYHLIDYGSTDDTWKIMNKYTNDPRVRAIKIVSQANKVHAMNESIRLAKGDFWVWCPADDRLDCHLLERAVEYSKRYPGAVLYSDAYIINETNRVIAMKRRPEFTEAELAEVIWQKSVIGFTGIVIPMYIFRDMNLYFCEEENYSEDYRWMIEAVMQGIKFRHIPEYLVYKRKHKSSCTKREYDDIIANIGVIHKELREKYDK